jgi:hypothetical protein
MFGIFGISYKIVPYLKVVRHKYSLLILYRDSVETLHDILIVYFTNISTCKICSLVRVLVDKFLRIFKYVCVSTQNTNF